VTYGRVIFAARITVRACVALAARRAAKSLKKRFCAWPSRHSAAQHSWLLPAQLAHILLMAAQQAQRYRA